MPLHFERLHQRFSDPILTLLTLMLSFLLFVIGPMQTAGVISGSQFGYFFGLVLLPAALLYSRNLLVIAPVAVAIALVVTAALLANVEAIIGQIYPATLLARLVTLELAAESS